MAEILGGGANILGLRQVGNIDLLHRPVVRNKGGISTVLSTSFGTPQGEVLVPRVVGGKIVSPAEAYAHYQRTGRHLGIFDTPANADAYAQTLHREQAAQYLPHPLTRALAQAGALR